jgi:hypothetical protein
LVPDHESHPLIKLASPDNSEDEIPVQFAKINIFQDRQLLSGRNFPPGDDRFDGWHRIVQVDKCDWIPSFFVVGLVFVAFEDDDAIDDCKGMSNFYVVKHRISGRGDVSLIPRHACPPFPGQIESFHNL